MQKWGTKTGSQIHPLKDECTIALLLHPKVFVQFLPPRLTKIQESWWGTSNDPTPRSIHRHPTSQTPHPVVIPAHPLTSFLVTNEKRGNRQRSSVRGKLLRAATRSLPAIPRRGHPSITSMQYSSKCTIIRSRIHPSSRPPGVSALKLLSLFCGQRSPKFLPLRLVC